MANGPVEERRKREEEKLRGIISGKDPRTIAKRLASEGPQIRRDLTNIGRFQEIGEARKRLLGEQAGEFDRARRAFQGKAELAIGQQVGGAQRTFAQQAARRGLTGSGVEQAGVQAVQAAGAGQLAQSLFEFDEKIALAQQQEQAAFRAGEFNFLLSLNQMAAQADIEKDLMRFQAKLAADQQGFLDFNNLLNLGTQALSLIPSPVQPAFATAQAARGAGLR